MAEQRLETEAKLRVSLDPAARNGERTPLVLRKQRLLDGVASPAGTGSDRTSGINLWEFVEDILPALLQVDEGLAAPVLSNGVREL